MQIDGILNRASAITLKARGPDRASLQEILRAGIRAPDHGNMPKNYRETKLDEVTAHL